MSDAKESKKESLNKFQKELLEEFLKKDTGIIRITKKEVDVIRQMDNETLIDAFEDLLRKGAGPGVFKLIWVKREIMRRMNRGDVQ